MSVSFYRVLIVSLQTTRYKYEILFDGVFVFDFDEFWKTFIEFCQNRQSFWWLHGDGILPTTAFIDHFELTRT